MVWVQTPAVFAFRPWSVFHKGNPHMTDRPLRVLHFDHTARWSGGEIALLRMVEAMDPGLVDSTVLLAEDGPLRTALESGGTKVLVEPLAAEVRNARKESIDARSTGRVRAIGVVFSYVLRVARIARSLRADVIHTNSLKADLIGGFAGRLAGIPVVWHVHDHIEEPYLPRFAVVAFRLLVRILPRHVVGVSSSVLERIFPGGGDRGWRCGTVVHGGIDPEGGGSWPEAAPAPRHGNPPVIGIVGRLARWKGQHVFLEAARLLRERGIDARFVIVGTALFGEDDYAAELRRFVESSDLGAIVEFAGFSDRIPETLRTFDVCVHASISPEPFGQVVIEAMAAGVPVVAADAGGVKEIVEDGVSGLLVPPGDASALADAIAGLLSDRDRSDAIAGAGYARMASTFTAANTARKMERVLTHVARRR